MLYQQLCKQLDSAPGNAGAFGMGLPDLAACRPVIDQLPRNLPLGVGISMLNCLESSVLLLNSSSQDQDKVLVFLINSSWKPQLKEISSLDSEGSS